MPSFLNTLLLISGSIVFVGVSVMGIRMAFYWWNFLFRWKRYRHPDPISTNNLRALDVPYIKVQIG